MSGRPRQIGLEPDADVPGQLRELLGQVAALAAEVAAVRAALTRRTLHDDEAHGMFLPALAAAVRDSAFSARELVAHAALPDAGALADALRACGGTTPRRAGRLLRRIEGRTFAGLTVRRIGDDRDGAVWRCEFREFPG